MKNNKEPISSNSTGEKARAAERKTALADSDKEEISLQSIEDETDDKSSAPLVPGKLNTVVEDKKRGPKSAGNDVTIVAKLDYPIIHIETLQSEHDLNVVIKPPKSEDQDAERLLDSEPDSVQITDLVCAALAEAERSLAPDRPCYSVKEKREKATETAIVVTAEDASDEPCREEITNFIGHVLTQAQTTLDQENCSNKVNPLETEASLSGDHEPRVDTSDEPSSKEISSFIDQVLTQAQTTLDLVNCKKVKPVVTEASLSCAQEQCLDTSDEPSIKEISCFIGQVLAEAQKTLDLETCDTYKKDCNEAKAGLAPSSAYEPHVVTGEEPNSDEITNFVGDVLKEAQMTLSLDIRNGSEYERDRNEATLLKEGGTLHTGYEPDGELVTRFIGKVLKEAQISLTCSRYKPNRDEENKPEEAGSAEISKSALEDQKDVEISKFIAGVLAAAKHTTELQRGGKVLDATFSGEQQSAYIDTTTDVKVTSNIQKQILLIALKTTKQYSPLLNQICVKQ